jgi:hypothetical protein
MSFNNLRIVNIPSDQRVWIVRAGEGRYINNFRNDGIIAIGHADILNLNDKTKIAVSEKHLQSRLERAFKQRDARLANMPNHRPITKAQVTQTKRQISTFVNKMKIGDLVITPTANHLDIGRITSDALISTQSSEFKPSNREPIVMKNNLRRNVVWLPSMSRSVAPPATFPLLTGQSTVFELTKNKDAFYHLLYPFFTRNGKLHTAVTIQQNSDIDGFSIAKVGDYIAKLEVMARHPEISKEEFDAFFREYVENGDISFTDKAFYMSKGTKYFVFAGVLAFPIVCIGLNILFTGGKVSFKSSMGEVQIEGNGAVKAEHITKMLEMYEDNYGNRINKKLEPTLTSVNTQILEDDSQLQINKLDYQDMLSE